LQVCDSHASYWAAQLFVMHVVHALLDVSLHGELQLACMQFVKPSRGAVAVAQLDTKHDCSQSGGDTWRPMPPTFRLPLHIDRQLSVSPQATVPVPNMSGLWTQ
jgi:hypothetical protein